MKNLSVEGLVVKVTDQHVVLFCKDGSFRNVPRPSDEVPKLGQSYSFTEAKKRGFARFRIASLVAVFLLAVLSFAIFASNQASAAYCVAIDINPKVEVYADQNFHVTKVEALNDDGQQIKASLHIKGHSLFEVVQQVVQNAISQGFLPKDQKGLITTTIIPLQKDVKGIHHEIQRAIQKPLRENAVAADVMIMDGNKQLLENARKKDLSVNQFQFYKNLKNEGITANEVRGKTMTQLKDMVGNSHSVQPQAEISRKDEKQTANSKQTNRSTKMNETEHQNNGQASSAKTKGQPENGNQNANQGNQKGSESQKQSTQQHENKNNNRDNNDRNQAKKQDKNSHKTRENGEDGKYQEQDKGNSSKGNDQTQGGQVDAGHGENRDNGSKPQQVGHHDSTKQDKSSQENRSSDLQQNTEKVGKGSRE